MPALSENAGPSCGRGTNSSLEHTAGTESAADFAIGVDDCGSVKETRADTKPTDNGDRGTTIIRTAVPQTGHQQHLRRRQQVGEKMSSGEGRDGQSTRGPDLPIIGEGAETDTRTKGGVKWLGRSSRSAWIGLAVASGGCAAFNGVFAKLTTTELTASLAGSISRVLGLEDNGSSVELVVRCLFFALNMIFNGIMWSLFTAALSRGTSTTQVSIVNTSTNFVATALLGLAIFSESLPPMWWLGASMLVAGNVIIGRSSSRGGENENEAAGDRGADEAGRSEEGDQGFDRMYTDYAGHGDVELDGIKEKEDILDLGDL